MYIQKLLLKGGRFFDGERFAIKNLLLENGTIKEIGKIDCSDALKIDVSGLIVCSGLVDIHAHLLEMGNTQFGFPTEMACLPFGVAYAVDVCAELGNLDIVDFNNVKSKLFIPIMVKGNVLDYESMKKRIDYYGERCIGIKVFFDKEQFDYITKEHLVLACELAKKHGLKVMVHSTGSDIPMSEIVEVLDKGDILTHVYHGGRNSVCENDYYAYKLAKNKGVVLDVGMAGGVHTDFKILKDAIKKGFIPDTISSDLTLYSAYMRGGIYGLTTCLSVLKKLGMKEKDVINCVTKNAGKAITSPNWFNVNVGDKATLTCLKYGKVNVDLTDKSKNRLKIKKGYTCKLTIVNGRILYRS